MRDAPAEKDHTPRHHIRADDAARDAGKDGRKQCVHQILVAEYVVEKIHLGAAFAF